jgi:uncharacterized membrane protein
MFNVKINFWLIGFGAFLIACGIAGYASNPEAAKTALISGSTFGGLSILLGIWTGSKRRLIPYAISWGVVIMLIAAFAWRSTVTWMAVAEGQPKLFAAILISSMGIASLLTLLQLWRSRSV